MTTTTRWWWIRHAPVINPDGRIYGRNDVEADCSDLPSCRTLALGLPTDAVWVTSHLRRTHQTAKAILAARDEVGDHPEFQVETDLAEQDFGSWQGMSHAELDAGRDGRVHRFWLAPAVERPPGGESFLDLVARTSNAVMRLSHAHAGRDIVAVTHGGTIRAALAMALGLDPERALGFRIDNLSLTRIDHIMLTGDHPAWRVGGVNLPALGVPPLS